MSCQWSHLVLGCAQLRRHGHLLLGWLVQNVSLSSWKVSGFFHYQVVNGVCFLEHGILC